MEKADKNILPVIGTVLLILFYSLSILLRGILSPEEYEFALMLKKIVPSVSGDVIPKIPAAAATLTTAALLWLSSAKLNLRHPGTSAAMYLCFPPVWWLGTSAGSAPLLALFTGIAAAGLFIARKEKNFFRKFPGFACGITGAAGAAVFVQSGYFSWVGVFLAFLPVFFLSMAMRLEKLEDRQLAAAKLNRWALFTAIILLFMFAMLVTPSICRHFKINYPEYLSLFHRGEFIYRPASALLIPLAWLFLAKKSETPVEKLFFICFAAGFAMLMLSATIPWSRISESPSGKILEPLKKELLVNNPTLFADDTTAAAIEYNWQIPVTRIGRKGNDMRPNVLSAAVKKALTTGDVIVVNDEGELDSFIPKELEHIVFTSAKNCKLILFPGGKK